MEETKTITNHYEKCRRYSGTTKGAGHLPGGKWETIERY